MKGMSDSSMDEYLVGSNGVIVYLESADDALIFDKWFYDLLDKIEFQSISGKRADGGCGAILKYMEENNELPYIYGVVDRDVLLRNIDSTKYPTCKSLWWNNSDDEILSSVAFGDDRIFILHRWELENYLLHPEALLKRLKNRTRNMMPFSTAEEVAEKIIENESDLVLVTLFSTLGKGTVASERYAQTVSGNDLLNEVKGLNTSPTDSEINEHSKKIIRFAEGKENSLERWDRLSRMLDGKRTMYRLDKILHENPREFCLEKEYCDLADDIVNLNLVDKPLRNWLENLS